VYATVTDVPFLEPRWITRLAELIGDHELAIPHMGDEYHPLAALYRKAAVLPVLERMLDRGDLKLKAVVHRAHTRVVDEVEMRPVDPHLGTLRNLDHPEDYEQTLWDAG
jgi:molybdenum cofactor guanylyltransferase